MMTYYLEINGGPKVGWPRTFRSLYAAEAEAREVNQREGLMATVAIVPSHWTVSPEGDIAWLIGGTAGLRYQRNVSAPWAGDAR